MQILDRWRWSLEEFVDRNRGAILFLAALFFIGVVFGALAVRSLELTDKLELVQYLGSTAGALELQPAGVAALSLRRALAGNAKLLALVWILGVSVVGAPGVMLLALLRGFVSGFTVAFLAAEMGLPGVLLAVAGHVPQSLIEVPVIVLLGAAALSFAGLLIRRWREGRSIATFYPMLGSYSVTLLGLGLLLVAGSLVESYLSPLLVRTVASLLVSR